MTPFQKITNNNDQIIQLQPEVTRKQGARGAAGIESKRGKHRVTGWLGTMGGTLWAGSLEMEARLQDAVRGRVGHWRNHRALEPAVWI